jgi:hypothetical protein
VIFKVAGAAAAVPITVRASVSEMKVRILRSLLTG